MLVDRRHERRPTRVRPAPAPSRLEVEGDDQRIAEKVAEAADLPTLTAAEVEHDARAWTRLPKQIQDHPCAFRLDDVDEVDVLVEVTLGGGHLLGRDVELRHRWPGPRAARARRAAGRGWAVTE